MTASDDDPAAEAELELELERIRVAASLQAAYEESGHLIAARAFDEGGGTRHGALAWLEAHPDLIPAIAEIARDILSEGETP